MNATIGSLVLCLSVMASACGPATNEPSETPKTSRPPDRTEVTMEVTTAAPPSEPPPSAAPAATGAPAASAAPAASGGPAAKDAPEDPTIGGPQADPVVEKAVAPVRPRLHVCYKKALSVDPHVTGGATFDATLGKDGHVASARFVKRDGLNEEMVGCLLTAVKAMTFEPGRKTQIVTLSFGGAGSPAAAKH